MEKRKWCLEGLDSFVQKGKLPEFHYTLQLTIDTTHLKI